ncbi:MAG: T9SS type A sorting domain-containing protein [Flavobacteriaceae bacterium]|nr:T9SS type A sorting domain-containing protein [Flavobacteriaceae bacterium]
MIKFQNQKVNLCILFILFVLTTSAQQLVRDNFNAGFIEAQGMHVAGEVFNQQISTSSNIIIETILDIEDSSLSNENFDFDNDILLYPNPTSDKVTLRLSNLNVTQFDLYNELGQLIQTNKINELIMSIDLESFSTGVYLLQIKKENKLIRIFKIIKK